MRLKGLKHLRTASFHPKFAGFYKNKRCITGEIYFIGGYVICEHSPIRVRYYHSNRSRCKEGMDDCDKFFPSLLFNDYTKSS